MRSLVLALVIALALLAAACMDITVRVPCSATVLRTDTSTTDTLAVFYADSLACPE